MTNCGIRLVSALPETWLVHLIRMAEEDPGMTLVRLAKEEEGVGLSMGAHLAGVRSAMLMQNHGFLASINGVVSGAQLYRIPLLMLISHRGEFGERDPWQTEGGGVAEHVLESLRIEPDFTGRTIADSLKLVAGQQVRQAYARARSQEHFTELILTPRGDMDELTEAACQIMPPVEGHFIENELELLRSGLDSSLRLFHQRAQTGTDWGADQSPMVQAAKNGEVGAIRMGVSLVRFVAHNLGDFETVPLRHPAAEAAPSVLYYPFPN
jgi:sulfopyruvate decarboxylase subunit alpha